MSASVNSRPKRILIFSEDYPPAHGGIAEWAFGMAHGLSTQGHAIEVCTRRRVAAPEPDDAVPITFAEGRRWRRYRTWYWRRAARAALSLESAPDLIICTTWNCARGVLPVARRSRVPVVTVVHGLEVTRRMPAIKRWWLRSTLIGSHRVVAVSTFTAGRVVADCPALERRVAVLPNGVDLDRFFPGPKSTDLLRQFGLAPTNAVILTLARVVPRKGHDQVIRALPRILAEIPRAKYLICGPGSEQHVEELRRQAGELGVGDAVIFGGYVAPGRLNEVYNLCDVYVMPSRVIEEDGDVEGFGITFLEANACRKPVVGGNSGGVPDAVVDGENGFLVDPTSHTEIANTIIRLLNDPVLSGNLGRQGLDRIGRRYTWNAIASQFDDVILSTVGS